MIKIKEGKKYLVTGGSGFLGGKVIQRILNEGGQVVTLSRDEGKLIELKQKFPEIEFFTGDICDPFDVHQAMRGVHGIFHLAAFKHVGMAEDLARECTRSNVLGSLNILEEGARLGVDFIVGISTDKAAQVAGVYGATKYVMEKLFEQFEKNYPEIEFRVVRYGNILYSTGSVLCKWKELLLKGEPLIVTDPNATRYFWTVDQAVTLIWDCLDNATDSKPYVPEMKSMSIRDLLVAMSEKYLPEDKELLIKEIGLQPGENLHEKILVNGTDSSVAEKYTIEEITEMI
jgi:FlaA1/EpsC-like NDP-sugar epimerase